MFFRDGEMKSQGSEQFAKAHTADKHEQGSNPSSLTSERSEPLSGSM